MFFWEILKRPDVPFRRKNINFPGLLPFVALLFIFINGYSQSDQNKDTILRVSPGTYIQIRDSISFFLNDTLVRLPSSLIPQSAGKKDPNLVYYDSLRQKASRKPLTKKIYDLVVIAPQPSQNKKISGSSDESYLQYTGKRIKSIDVVRMDVFGTDINNPAAVSDKNSTYFLNKTHVNTNERIIRKNILFSVGDTVSPLTLSDNERILRELPFIDDARIIIVPVSEDEADILVITKDIYSLGGEYDYGGLKKGTLSVFERNILGTGHEFGLKIPFDSHLPDSPGIGGYYAVNNLWKSFTNLKADYMNGLGVTTYGLTITRNFVSATTKYAGGITVRQTFTTTDLDTLPLPEPLKYNFQDYWAARSFLVDRESVSRIIIGARYVNNNVFKKPEIPPQSYYNLQKYRLYMASAALSVQKFYKTNLLYGYGRTEDIPYGGLVRLTAGREFNEFKNRTYISTDISAGKSFPSVGYIYASLAVATFLKGAEKEQGIFYARANYFSNLLPIGRFRSRNFVYIDYSRGFGRYLDEYLRLQENNGFTGFSNDSINGHQRLTVSLESVLFAPGNYLGFRFALFAFGDIGMLSGSNEFIGGGFNVTSLGLGLRIRNDNLLFNTLQIRLSYFPNPPMYSEVNNITISGEQLLRPNNFNAGKPLLIPFR